MEELNTDGAFLTQDMLFRMKEIGCRPLMKISFDGVGYHDRMRNRAGAEKDALRAMKLCINNGFTVKAQTNVHRLNLHTMLPTLKLLDDIGVSRTRIIRTTEAPLWKQNAWDACLTFNEYYDEMLKLASEYIKTDCRMTVNVWNYMTIYPISRQYDPDPIRYNAEELTAVRSARGTAVWTLSPHWESWCPAISCQAIICSMGTSSAM